MDLTLTEQSMYSVLQIQMHDAPGNTIGYATGFIFAFAEDSESNGFAPTLVTNRHVIEGCKKVSVLFTLATTDGNPDVGHTVQAEIDTNIAILHPNPSIDLGVLPLGPAFKSFADQGINIFYSYLSRSVIPTAEEWKSFDAVETLLMLGYPRGMRDTFNNFPIFRRGITATPLAYDFQGAPVFLIDMPCFEGCSGSPVLLIEDGAVSDPRSHVFSIRSRARLLGIQYAIPAEKNIGNIEFVQSSTSVPRPVMQAYLNLGFVIKSTELDAFEAIILRRLGR